MILTDWDSDFAGTCTLFKHALNTNMVLLSVKPHFHRIFTRSIIASIQYHDFPVPHKRGWDLLSSEIPIMNHDNMLKVNSHLKLIVKTGCLADARAMFDKMPQRDEVSWTTMISGYVGNSDFSKALILFSNMWVQPGIGIDVFTVSLVLKACGLSTNLRFGEVLHGYTVKTGLVNSIFVGTALLSMYMKVGQIGKGFRAFNDMPTKNVVSWTTIITGLVHSGYNELGLKYFSQMQESKVECDSYAFAIALKACADSEALNCGRAIHAQTMKKGFNEISFVANSLATLYNKCGKLDYTLYLFDKMSHPDVVSWTTVISTYTQMGLEERAVWAFQRMRESNASPNEYTYATVLSACANISSIKWGQELHACVLRLGLIDSLSVANSVMTMYSRCGRLSSASVVFNGMRIRDIISWSTIIGAHSQGGCGEEAFEYLSLMRREGEKPNEFAIASVLSICGSMAIIEQGKQLHAHILSIGLETSATIHSALVNMYSKCGSIKEAFQVFDACLNNNIFSWTAMINGYAEHGFSKEAIDLFEKIQRVDLRPDFVTFIGVLTACSHAGLIDLGFHYFNLMGNKYRINPSKEHYGCMIDLLCRAGQLSHAEEMIRSMPCHQDDVVWSTLLRACWIHGDIDRGRRAAEEILKLDTDCAGTHITMANIYASKGKWREAAKERTMMRSKQVVKETGWSWVKVKDMVSSFVSGDRRHPQAEDIFFMVELLGSRTGVSSHDEMVYVLTEVEE